MKPEESPQHKSIKAAVLICMVLVVLSYCGGQISDIDFWYHLSTGRQTVHDGALPSGDPYSFSWDYTPEFRLGPGADNLRGYWMAQVIMYGAYRLAGFYGIVALRLALIMGALWIAYAWARRRGASQISAVFVLIIVAASMDDFCGDRPQLFSFMLAPLVLMIAEEIRREPDSLGIKIALPLVMILWANLHRGFPMGTALLGLYLIAETVDIKLLKREAPAGALMALWIVVPLSIAATLVNPNGYLTYLSMFQLEGSQLQGRISEYMSPIKLIASGKLLTGYWIILVLALGITILKRIIMRASGIVIILFLCGISLSAVRYVPFLLIVGGSYIASEDDISINPDLKRWAWIGIVTLIIVMLTSSFTYKVMPMIRSPYNEAVFPRAAAEQIKDRGLKGNMLNHFNWGGFLIWKLYPGQRVFVDSRTLNLKAMSDYTHMIWATPEGMGMIDKYRMDIVIMPGLNPFTGEMYALVDRLAGDPGWKLAYADAAALVFVRRGSPDDAIADKVDKAEAYEHVITQARGMKQTLANKNNLDAAIARASRALGR